MLTLAILGANGQIGRSLAASLANQPLLKLKLFSRDIKNLEEFVHTISNNNVQIDFFQLDEFSNHKFDIVVNAIGEGSRTRQLALGAKMFDTSAYYDCLVIKYLIVNPKTLYFFISSGAVYGFNTEWPVNMNSVFSYPVNSQSNTDHYPLSKIVNEARHSCYPDLKIYDVRIFGFFSQYINIKDSFFLSEVADAIISNKTLITDNTDMVRDYISGSELGSLISSYMQG
ncbi:MAG: NAD-dependent epimerase/dehydratase family protein, partial [Pseudomonadota bacterium]|nr:NAD-dependent epimerase/dehydratase family protein [Pseudomonadota bacterium]